nr:hypothetical protein [uncultured Butyricicoccus sp.]
MDEYLKKKLLVIAGIILIILCVALVIIGQRQTGQWSGLGIQMIGLAGILALLYVYNKPYSN